MNYTFSTLNDKEFEKLARDLLNSKFNFNLQNFKVGQDKGIDLRFSTSNNNNSIVVQAKHYVGSGFSQLKHVLSKRELVNVKALNPDRYIVVTSLPLSPQDKDELKALLSPFILTPNDIIGQEDLNGYLNEFKEIEKNHFKLWFSSINVFETVIHNAIEGRTRYLLEQIRSKVPFYVVTKKLDDALNILQKEKLLLITGQPGIGKTTLAEIILFEKARNGHKIYKVENIREAEDVISVNDEEKQLFYFDDFLGANYFEIVNAHKTETQLTSFVERLKNTPNKYLILTTRTVILNYAFEKYEKISHSKLANQQFEIKLTDYTKFEKALILYNHLYFNRIPENLHNQILKEKFYKKIIAHKNYTPRIIEFITERTRIENLNADSYLQFILNNLNNPKEIWRYSYNNQIEYLDQCLLITLFTFEGNSYQSPLLAAYERRLNYEKTEHNQIIATNQFDTSIKILLNGFILSILHGTNPPIRQYQFINPSLADFLIGHVSDSYPERKGIIFSLTFVEQLTRFDPEKSLIPMEKELQIHIRDRILKKDLLILESSSQSFTDNKKHAILLETLCKYCYQVNIDTPLLENFKQLSFDTNWYTILEEIIYVLTHLGDAPQTFDYVSNNFIRIIEKIMDCIDGERFAKRVPEIFEKFDFDYEEYCDSDNGFSNIINLIESVLKSNEETLIRNRRDEIKDFDEVSEIYDEIDSLENDLMGSLFPTSSIYYDFGINLDKEYWNNKIEQNLEREERLENEINNFDYFKDSPNEMNEDEQIDDLFNTAK